MVEKPEPAATPGEEPLENRRPGRNWAVAGVIFGSLAFVLIPFLFGTLGILFGAVGFLKGARRLGKIAIGVSILSLVLGTILYVLLLNLINQP